MAKKARDFNSKNRRRVIRAVKARWPQYDWGLVGGTKSARASADCVPGAITAASGTKKEEP